MLQLDRNSPIPLYHQLKEYILERVERGDYPVGESLPPEMELVKGYGVSRATVRRAMQELEQEGFIDRFPGKGTFVLRTKLNRGLTRLTSFTEDMKLCGYEVTSRLLKCCNENPPAYVADALQVSEDRPLLFISRLRYAGEQPMAINNSFLNLPEGVSITEEEIKKSGSLFALLDRKGIKIMDSDRTIEAVAANEERARLLGMTVGAPLLLVEGIVYTLNHVAIEYHQVISCGERYKYSLHLDR